ncbi:MAG: DoxX family protein [Rhodothermales bacterium]
MDILVLMARVFFSMLFILSGFGHLSQRRMMAQYARSKNVPAPRLAVLVTGVMIIFGGFSVLLGAFVKYGALLLVVFLLVAAYMMHGFWRVDDPVARQNEMVHFMKDLSLAGAAFLIWYHGTGPFSLMG